jgi:hypothetical protein
MISKNEGPLAKVIYTGIALVVIGIICFMTGLLMSMVIGGMFFAVLPGIGMGLGVLGLAITLFAILFGLKKESSSYSKTPVRVPNCKITARFFINRNGEELFNESYLLEDEAPPKYYIRLQTQEGKSWELKCHAETWRFCGEGMKGTATIQGDWLGRFEPEQSPQPPANANPHTPNIPTGNPYE